MAVIARALDVARSNLYEQRGLEQTEVNASASEPQCLAGIAQVVKKYVDEITAYGYRRITALIRRDAGLKVNHKRYLSGGEATLLVAPTSCLKARQDAFGQNHHFLLKHTLVH